jgi:hypothetical protein
MTVIFCTCNQFIEQPSGGGVAGGSWELLVSHTDMVGGGVGGGGSWDLEITNDPTDGLVGWWGLNEEGNGTASEYKDRTRFARHGTGGVDSFPDWDAGVFCQPSALFLGNQVINLPSIPLPQAFTVSMWARLDSDYAQRDLIQVGPFRLKYTVLRHLWATITTDGEETEYDSFSNTMLDKDRWYFLAASFDGSKLKVYINGSEAGSVDVAGVPVVGGECGIGINGSPEGNLQDVRIYAGVLSEDHLHAIHDNYCRFGFLVQGEEEEASFTLVHAS